MSGRHEWTSAKSTAAGALCMLCCCLFCCALPGVGGVIALNSIFGEWVTVEAVVAATQFCDQPTDIDREYNNNDRTYSITYTYTPIGGNGTEINATTSFCTSEVPGIGDKEEIRYDPNDETDVVPDGILTLGFTAAKIAAGIGWICVVGGMCLGIFFCQKANNNSGQNPYPNTNATSSPHTTAYATPVGTTNNAYNTPAPSGGGGDFGNSLGPSEMESASSPPLVYATTGASAPPQPQGNSTAGAISYTAPAPAAQPLVYTGGPVTNYK